MTRKMRSASNGRERYVSNDGKYSFYPFYGETKTIYYWKVLKIVDGVVYEDRSSKTMRWKYGEDYVPSADVLRAMKACGSIEWAVRDKHIPASVAEKILAASKALEEHVDGPDADKKAPAGPSVTAGPGRESVSGREPVSGRGLAPTTMDAVETLEPQWEDMLSRRPGASLREAMAGVVADKNKSYAYKKGIRGEELTASVLEPLADAESNEFVLHSVPLTDKMDIDHILVDRAGIFVVNSKNYNRLTVNRDQIAYESNGVMKPVTDTWIQTAARNAEIIRGKLMAYGYDARSIPMHILFSVAGDLNVIRTPDVPAGCASIAFMNYKNIPEYVRSIDAERSVQLSPRLMRFMRLDMRRSSFWV